jgi:hypothetical protein
MTIVRPPPAPVSLRALMRRRAGRRHAGSMLAAWAQVGLALVIALGSIGLASVAALIAPDAGVAEEVATTAMAGRVPLQAPKPGTPAPDARVVLL